MPTIKLIQITDTEPKLDATARALITRCVELYADYKNAEKAYGSDSTSHNIRRSRWASLYQLIQDLGLKDNYITAWIEYTHSNQL